jgi:hypothetical protein
MALHLNGCIHFHIETESRDDQLVITLRRADRLLDLKGSDRTTLGPESDGHRIDGSSVGTFPCTFHRYGVLAAPSREALNGCDSCAHDGVGEPCVGETSRPSRPRLIDPAKINCPPVKGGGDRGQR